jgi:hypothetical protein
MRHHVPAQLAETRQPTRLAFRDPAASLDQAPTERGDIGGFLLQLQRSHGNRFVQLVVNHARAMRTKDDAGLVPMIQTKLVLGSTDDRYEREADRVAWQITSRTTSHSAADGTRASATGSAHLNLEASVNRASGRGEPLTDSVAAPMEEAFGVDFRRVRLHSDSESDELCRSISARAFTSGDHIFLRRGEDAGAPAGMHLLAHELTHVVQQRGQAVRPGDASGPARGRLAPRNTIQRFWVWRNGHYHWVSGQSRKRLYHRTNLPPRQTFWHPSPHRTYIDPWDAPGLQVDPDARTVLTAPVIADLETIRSTDAGAALLRRLAKAARSKTTIYPVALPLPPQTSAGREGPSVRVHSEDFDAVDLLKAEGRSLRETETAVWNPVPHDVVLFHELVHAYHRVKGMRATGTVTRDQAIHPGDEGVKMSEYQAVGLDTRDGDPNHAYSQDRFTENQYRHERHLPRRHAYTLESRREYSESSRQSVSGKSSESPSQSDSE